MVAPTFPMPFYPKFQPDIVNILLNQIVEFYCPGSSIVLRGQDTRKFSIQGQCTYPNNISKSHYSSNEIICNGPKVVQVRKSFKACALGGATILYQYALRNNIFMILRICFRKKKGVPLYSFYIIRPRYYKIVEKPIAWKSIKFDRNIFPNGTDPLSIQLYKMSVQRARFNNLLHIYQESSSYIHDDFHLTPTFLSPVEDFYSEEMKDIARTYANVVPQWKIIKYNNWEKLEAEVRRCTNLIGFSLKVWTGTFGTFKLTGHGNIIPFHMHTRNTSGMYPIPGSLWKLLYASKRKAAIILVMFHNPFFKSKDFKLLCTDVSSTAGWMIGWDKSNVTAGYAYACKYYEFKSLIHYLPAIEVKTLLKCEKYRKQ